MYNNEEKYIYFLCSKSIADKNLTDEQLKEVVEDIMKAGLVMDGNFTLNGRQDVAQVEEGYVESCAGGIKEVVENFRKANPQNDFITVLKIPKQYLALEQYTLENGQVGMDFPLPFFVKKQDNNGNMKIGITKSLVSGIYCDRLEGDFYENPNYNPAIDPSGLYYTEEQMQAILQIGGQDMYDFVKDRNQAPNGYTLREQERTEELWLEKMQDYAQVYTANPTNKPLPDIVFKSLEDIDQMSM